MKNPKEDPVYIALHRQWLIDLGAIRILNVHQAQLRATLKTETDQEKICCIRQFLKTNRRGRDGLRSLNRRIRQFYEYCDKHNIWP